MGCGCRQARVRGVPTRIAELDLSPALTTELAPLFAVYASLNEQIAAADRRIATVAASDPTVARLATAPGVGPVTASAFVATIDDQHAVLFGRVRV